MQSDLLKVSYFTHTTRTHALTHVLYHTHTHIFTPFMARLLQGGSASIIWTWMRKIQRISHFAAIASTPTATQTAHPTSMYVVSSLSHTYIISSHMHKCMSEHTHTYLLNIASIFRPLLSFKGCEFHRLSSEVWHLRDGRGGRHILLLG